MSCEASTVVVPAHYAVYLVPVPCCIPDGCTCGTVQPSNN